MKLLAFLSIWLALPLAAQEKKDLVRCPGELYPCSTAAAQSGSQTKLTADEHDAYVLMVIQDLAFQNALLENLRTHKAGNDDLENRDHAHAERLAALKQLAAKHSACEGGDWNIAKKEWSCPTGATARPPATQDQPPSH